MSAPVLVVDQPGAMPELSIVVPVYNEAEAILPFLSTVINCVESSASSFELIIVDDGSEDETALIVSHLSARDSRLTLVRLSRNFGKEAALDAGLMIAKGRALLFMDADYQHPPYLIASMVESWRAGADVVNAKKRARGYEHRWYRFLSHRFNQLFTSLSGVPLDGASDFKLIDRQVAEALKQCPERNRFFRGLVAWVGFHQQDILFDVGERHAGRSGWSFRRLFSYAVNNILAFTSFPLIAIAGLGAAAIVVSVVLVIQTLFNYMLGNAVQGFTTVLVAIAFFGSVTLLSVGVVALYIAKIYDEQKARPVYLVKATRRQCERHE